jgi:hypothetical protein
MAEIVNTYVVQSRSFPDATPRMLKIRQVRFLLRDGGAASGRASQQPVGMAE